MADEVPGWVEPMLAKPDGGRLPAGPAWTYEYKLDGYRAAMRMAASGETVLTSRNGIDFTDEFASLTGVLDPVLDGRAAVFDGEIVVYNDSGRADFGLMQDRRGRYQKHQKHIGGPFADLPVRYLVFDLLQLGNKRLLNVPYDERRALLEQIPMPEPHLISVVPAVPFDSLAERTPRTLLDQIADEGYEGLIAKHRTSLYYPGKRTDAWLKHALTRTQEVIVCGWRPGRSGFEGTLGGLLLGAHDPDSGDLVYIGDVGTGFSHRERQELKERLQPLERRGHPFAAAPPREDVARARWVEPILVGEVLYRQFTRGEGRLRHTSWRGLRHDRSPATVLKPQERVRRVAVQVGERRLILSNLEKPLYPNGFTKAQVITYYTRIAPVLLPHLAGHPITVSTFEAPSWLPAVDSTSVLITDLPALVWAVNAGAIELRTDRLVFSLGPGDCAPVALRLRDLLLADGLTPFATASRPREIQVHAPIRDAAHAARLARSADPGSVPISWEGPAVVPYSLHGRALPVVCTPVTWDEVESGQDLTFTTDEVLARVSEFGDLLGMSGVPEGPHG